MLRPFSCKCNVINWSFIPGKPFNTIKIQNCLFQRHTDSLCLVTPPYNEKLSTSVTSLSHFLIRVDCTGLAPCTSYIFIILQKLHMHGDAVCPIPDCLLFVGKMRKCNSTKQLKQHFNRIGPSLVCKDVMYRTSWPIRRTFFPEKVT